MAKLKLKGKELIALGYPEGPVIGSLLNIVEKNFRQKDKIHVLAVLQNLISSPSDYETDKLFNIVARQLQIKDELPVLLENGTGFTVFGPEHIEQEAIDQMKQAMRLPVTVSGALMPDAHLGRKKNVP